jgi:hypothetical protein
MLPLPPDTSLTAWRRWQHHPDRVATPLHRRNRRNQEGNPKGPIRKVIDQTTGDGPSLGSQDAQAVGGSDGRGARTNFELAIDIGEVTAYGPLADEEGRGDLAVGTSRSQ